MASPAAFLSRTVLITGANRGLGFELARLLLRRGGFHVVAASRAPFPSGPRTELRAVWEGTGSPLAELRFVELDVADPVSRARLAPQLSEALGGTRKLDLLCNVAGVYEREWSAAALARALATNASGPLRLAETVLPFAADGFHVINVSSGLGRLAALGAAGGAPHAAAARACASVAEVEALPFSAAAPPGPAPAYALSKAALNRGTQLLAAEWREAGHRVNSVDPGWCRTDMGGPAAARSPFEGALSIYALIAGHPGVIGTGKFFDSKGEHVEW